MAYIDPVSTRSLFNELKKSINEFYSKNTTLDMVSILRNTSKLEYFLEGNFENLWYMEQEDNANLKAKLEEVEDIYADMPPLVDMPEHEEMPPLVEMPSVIYSDVNDTNIIWPPGPWSF
jgi:hypothetical protein